MVVAEGAGQNLLPLDQDEKDQSGILSDIGLLPAGEQLVLDSSPHFEVESSGRWRLAELKIRLLNNDAQ